MKKAIPIIFMTLLVCFFINGQDTNVVDNQTSYKEKTIMAIFAHSDDECIISPVLSKYAKEGVNIYLVIVTDGSKGVTPHANIPAGDSLAKVRAEEALCVTKTLGINSPILLNYTDFELSLWENIFSLDDEIDSLFKTYQPDVVITFGPDGWYGHPDHRVVSNIVTEVFQREASEKLQQLLYVGFPKEYIDVGPKLNTEPAKLFKEHYKTTQKRFLTYRIPIDDEDLKMGRKALGCSKSQFTPDVMDEIFVLIGQTEGIIYLRSWNGSDTIKDNVFK